MAPPILCSMARKWGKKQGFKSYVYLFDRMLPGDKCGAWHSADLWYWFGTLDNCWRPMTDADYLISSQMSDYLCNFARKSDPNSADLPLWTPRRGRSLMRIGEGDTGMDRPRALKLCAIMLTNESVGE